MSQDVKPNILFIMTDQQRFDTIAALGNPEIYTPNYDRLVKRGITFTNAYSTCPVCVPARYTVRTGCEPLKTAVWLNTEPQPHPQQVQTMEGRCGNYLPRTMSKLGYRTFGIGKFHTMPAWDEELGYDIHLHTEELFKDPDQRSRDAFASFIANQHPEYDFVEQLHGERTNMYYIPQMSSLPAELTVESFVANKIIEQINSGDNRPYFGFASFIGPHPPCAPPIPYNRMYNPDKMPAPVKGDIEIDHMDEQISWMNHLIWAEDINDFLAKNLKSRYYGEISYIDMCLGKILDAVESSPDADNTLICFFSDHGDHLGDHHAWQKESYFEASCHIPFLLSWPRKLPSDIRKNELVCLTDLFGIATGAAGKVQTRDGIDVLGMLEGKNNGRDHLIGYYGLPETENFKIMVRWKQWKYIFMANGCREQLFNLVEDPNELQQKITGHPDIVEQMRKKAINALIDSPWAEKTLTDGQLKGLPYKKLKKERIHQFDNSRGVKDFPDQFQEALQTEKL